MGMTKDGKLFVWGHNEIYELGLGTQEDALSPVPLLGPWEEKKLVSFGCVHTTSFALTSDGDLYVWGTEEEGRIGLGKKESSHEPCLWSGFKWKPPDSVEERWKETFRWLRPTRIPSSTGSRSKYFITL
jgi:alpha-tubulin suppressor-like RCC1 family protein